MKTLRYLLPGVLLAATLGCHATPPLASAPGLLPVAGPPAVRAAGQVELSIRWPYRAQVLPTSSQRLAIVVQGTTSRRTVVDRPAGEAPLSVATLEVEAGEAYQISVEAYDASGLLIASGQSDPFIAVPNKKHAVTVTLQAAYVPSVLTLSPDHGGPGTLVTLTGANLGLERGFLPTVRFGGVSAGQAVQAGSDAVTIRVPGGAPSGAVGLTVDGVPDAGSTASFTVLSVLGIGPASASVTPGGAFTFTALATTDAGVAYPSPSVEWSLLPVPNPAYVEPGPEEIPSGAPYLPDLGTLDAAGRFVSNGATGSQWVQVGSGTLAATAAITVKP